MNTQEIAARQLLSNETVRNIANSYDMPVNYFGGAIKNFKKPCDQYKTEYLRYLCNHPDDAHLYLKKSKLSKCDKFAADQINKIGIPEFMFNVDKDLYGEPPKKRKQAENKEDEIFKNWSLSDIPFVRRLRSGEPYSDIPDNKKNYNQLYVLYVYIKYVKCMFKPDDCEQKRLSKVMELLNNAENRVKTNIKYNYSNEEKKKINMILKKYSSYQLIKLLDYMNIEYLFNFYSRSDNYALTEKEGKEYGVKNILRRKFVFPFIRDRLRNDTFKKIKTSPQEIKKLIKEDTGKNIKNIKLINSWINKKYSINGWGQSLADKEVYDIYLSYLAYTYLQAVKKEQKGGAVRKLNKPCDEYKTDYLKFACEYPDNVYLNKYDQNKCGTYIKNKMKRVGPLIYIDDISKKYPIKKPDIIALEKKIRSGYEAFKKYYPKIKYQDYVKNYIMEYMQ